MKIRLAPIAFAAAFGCALAIAHPAPTEAQSGTSPSSTNDNLPPKLSDKLNHVSKGGKHHEDAEETPKAPGEAGKSATTNSLPTSRPVIDPHGQ